LIDAPRRPCPTLLVDAVEKGFSGGLRATLIQTSSERASSIQEAGPMIRLLRAGGMLRTKALASILTRLGDGIA
jgi:hypothetical protein